MLNLRMTMLCPQRLTRGVKGKVGAALVSAGPLLLVRTRHSVPLQPPQRESGVPGEGGIRNANPA